MNPAIKLVLALTLLVPLGSLAQEPPPKPEDRSREWLMRLAGEYTTENEFSPAPGAPSRSSRRWRSTRPRTT